MSEEQVPEAAPTRSGNEDRLIRRLERAGEQLAGKRRLNFVDTKSLCTGCSHAAIIRRENKNHREVHCSWFSKPVYDDIMECSVYNPVTGLSLQQMAGIAWLIETRDTNQGYL